MRRYDRRQTFITFAQRIAHEHGHNISRLDASFILWEKTGFPSFFHGDIWETLDKQLTEAFRESVRD